VKTIVTGGAGFIGSHLVDRLLADGHEVVVLDNFSTGHAENIIQHKENKNFEVYKADISNHEAICHHFEKKDWVFHLAAFADIVPSIKYPLEYHNSNVSGTISVLEAARKNGIKRFIYTASSSCYGIPDIYPTSETAEIRTQYPYALTKYIGECYVLHWAKVYKLPAISLRLFNVYGPKARTSGTYGAVFGVFLAQKLAGKAFTVVGDGTQTRDFTFVTDVTNALVKAAESNISNDFFNVGSGNTYSINRLVELLEGEVTYIPKRPGEPNCTFADTSRIQKVLKWKPKISFEEGVKIMLKNIDYWRKAPVWTSEKIEGATREWFEYLGK
jgi:UDP-glucose 4-epimerase